MSEKKLSMVKKKELKVINAMGKVVRNMERFAIFGTDIFVVRNFIKIGPRISKFITYF